jgi:hypothetical protein
MNRRPRKQTDNNINHLNFIFANTDKQTYQIYFLVLGRLIKRPASNLRDVILRSDLET